MTDDEEHSAERAGHAAAVSTAGPLGPAGVGLTRAYRRLPAVEAEIAALPAPGEPGYRAAAERAQALETLVHAIRQLLRAGKPDTARALAETLAERAAPLFARSAGQQLSRRQAADIEDVAQGALERFWGAVFDLSPRQEFWEVHFREMVVRACAREAGAYRARLGKERQFARGVNAAGEAWDEEANLADPEPLDADLLVPEALDQLDGDVRRAVYLKARGFKAASKDAREMTIARALGVSDRTVRTYLREGEATLRAWLADGSG